MDLVHVQTLMARAGFAVVDGVFGEELSTSLLDEIKASFLVVHGVGIAMQAGRLG